MIEQECHLSCDRGENDYGWRDQVLAQPCRTSLENPMRSKFPVVLCIALLTVTSSVSCVLFSFTGGPLKFEPDVLPNAQLGAAYETEIHVRENDTPVGEFWISEGALPAGLELIKVEGEEDIARLSGVPEETGTFTFTINVWCYGTNVSGKTGEKEYSLFVEE
jgi:hypothetical protein